jgi:hypothetical protein
LYGAIAFGLWILFYRKATAPNDLQDWTILEEEESLVDSPIRSAASGMERKSSETDDIPIFFR